MELANGMSIAQLPFVIFVDLDKAGFIEFRWKHFFSCNCFRESVELFPSTDSTTVRTTSIAYFLLERSDLLEFQFRSLWIKSSPFISSTKRPEALSAHELIWSSRYVTAGYHENRGQVGSHFATKELDVSSSPNNGTPMRSHLRLSCGLAGRPTEPRPRWPDR